jgi:predicted TIM-barrel fold metal-dependent hydrolase
MAKCANDEMAQLIRKHPERFVSAAAALPLGDIDDTLKDRIACYYDLFEMRSELKLKLRKAPTEYFKMFHNDAAINGNSPALM